MLRYRERSRPMTVPHRARPLPGLGLHRPVLQGLASYFFPGDVNLILRILSGGVLAVMVTAVTYKLFQRLLRNAYLPEKQAILTAASIESFSWRATTFSFTNEIFSQRFEAIKQPLVMEI